MEKTLDKSAELRRGVIVFVVLAVLTVIEYIVGAAEAGSSLVPLLWLLAIVKGGLVLWYFMHLGRVFKSDGGH